MPILPELLDTPEDIPILAPVIEREILYRLLVGDQGTRLRQIVAAGSQSQKIARAIDWLKGNFAQPLRQSAVTGYREFAADGSWRAELGANSAEIRPRKKMIDSMTKTV